MAEATAASTHYVHEAGGLNQESLVGWHIFTLGRGVGPHGLRIGTEERPTLHIGEQRVIIVGRILSCNTTNLRVSSAGLQLRHHSGG